MKSGEKVERHIIKWLKDYLNKSKMQIDREKLNTQRQIAATNLEIARENKNKYDVQSKSKNKE